MMEGKCNCQPYEVDYEKVVIEIKEALYFRCEQLERELKDEKNPLKYIEKKAILDDVQHLNTAINDLIGHCKKPMDQMPQDDEVKQCL